MPWPLSQDYNEAIQNPQTSFGDPELRRGAAICGATGIPMPRSGNFADVYEFIGDSGTKWAIKCFTREVPGLQERYHAISKHLQKAKLNFTVDFEYMPRGIRIRGQFYPVLKMKWVDGFLLNEFVRDNLDKPAVLEKLGLIWGPMAKQLRKAGIAHGDLQHGNILLVRDSNTASLALKLIDYDGMWVPALAQTKSGEVGHANYQHPQRLREEIYNAQVDRFPLLLIATALRVLSEGGRELWNRYDNGDNLLFKEADLREPAKSALFKELYASSDVQTRTLVHALYQATQRPADEMPAIDALVDRAKLTTRGPAVSSRATPLPKPLVVADAPKPPPVSTSPPDFGASRRPEAKHKLARLWRNRATWAWFSGGGSAAAVLLFFVLVPPKPPDPVVKPNPAPQKPEKAPPVAVATKLIFDEEPKETQAGKLPDVRVKVVDQNDNVVASDNATEVTVTMSGPPDAVLKGGVSQKAVKGIAIFSDLTIEKADEGYTLKASADKLESGNSKPFTITPGQPEKLAFKPDLRKVIAGRLDALRVEVKDSYDNYAADTAVELVISPDPRGGDAEFKTLKMTESGVATFTDLPMHKASERYILKARTGNAMTSSEIKVCHADAAKLVFETHETVAMAGEWIKLTVRVQDKHGNDVTDHSTMIAITIAGRPTAATAPRSPWTIKAIKGIAKDKIIRAGDYLLTAKTIDGRKLDDAIIKTFTIRPAAPDHLTFDVQPSHAFARGSIGPVEVSVRDKYDNQILSFDSNITLEISKNRWGGTLKGGQAKADKGLAKFGGLSIDQVGSGYSLIAKAGDLLSENSKEFKIKLLFKHSDKLTMTDKEFGQSKTKHRVLGCRMEKGETYDITMESNSLHPEFWVREPAGASLSLGPVTSRPRGNGFMASKSFTAMTTGEHDIIATHEAKYKDILPAGFTLSIQQKNGAR